MPGTPRIHGQATRLSNGELAGDRPGDDRRHLGWVREELAEKADGRELYREPEPVVIAAVIGDPLSVKIIEVKNRSS